MKKRLKSLGKKTLQLSIGLLVVCGCSRAEILNLTIPRDGYTVKRDIAYGNEPRQKLDIYVPDGIKEPRAVIVFFYGGSWQKGSREVYRFVGQAFATKGYITVVADYRLYPEVKYPAFIEDGALAFAWVHKNIVQYGGDPKKLFLAGHSAGAYNAVMLATNETFLKKAGADPHWVRGAIGMAGPYDFLPFTSADIKDIFSTDEDVKTQVITYVKPHLPPMLLATGEQDKDVGPRNTQNMVAKLKANSDTVTERIYPGIAHIGIILSLADGFRNKSPMLDDIDHFIRENSAAR